MTTDPAQPISTPPFNGEVVADVFIVTYLHDLEWVQWAIAHVHKNLKGFRKIVAVAPVQDQHLFERIPGVVWHFIEDWPGRGYFWQQWVKIQAWKYTDAEVIVHVDSDTMIEEPRHVNEFFDGDGLPYWVMEPYEVLGDSVPWKSIVERAVKESSEYEFMRRFPFVIWRSTHELVEETLVRRNGVSLEHLIRDANGFSEFNVMGHLAHSLQRGRYAWVLPHRLPIHASGINQRWSHTPFDQVEPQLIASFGDVIPMLTDFGVWVIPGDTHLSKWIREHRRLDFDIAFLERICENIHGGDVVVDVGAFVGDHTLAYANMTSGSPGAVYAFEPNPVVFRCLVRNMERFSHVQCIEAGLSNRSSVASVSHDPNFGGVHLVEGDGDVKTMTLDSMSLPRLNLMKIDAEGMEVKILRGARETLRRCRPTLVIEVNEGALLRQGTSSSELRELIQSLNYEIVGDMLGLQYDIFCHPKKP